MDPITGVIALTGLTAAALAALRVKKEANEGFEVLPSGRGQTSYPDSVKESQTKYNSFMSMVNPVFNPLIPVGATAKEKEFISKDVGQTLGQLLAPYDPTSPEALRTKDFISRYPIRTKDDGGVYDAIRFCRESVQQDPSPYTQYALDEFGNRTERILKRGAERRVNDAQTLKFDEVCGVCLTSGVDEEGKPFNGRRGMVVDPSTVQSAQKEQRDFTYPFPRVAPSLGKCEGAPNSPAFAIDRETLDMYTKRMDCMKTKEINEKNQCGLCYENDTFSFVPDKVQKSTISVVLMGIGRFTISVKGVNIRTNITLSDTTPVSVPLILNQDVWTFDNNTRRWKIEKRVSPASEGDPFIIEVNDDPARPDDIPIVWGYMASTNPNGGQFALPLNIVLVRDNVTNSNPNRTGGFHAFPENGVEVAKIRPGGASGREMKLAGEIPFTFVQSSEFSGIDCPSAPYQTKSASVTRFASDQPCYAKGSKPGNYNDACLRERILDVGCTNAGTLFQNPKQLNRNSAGQPNTLSGIYNTLLDIAQNDMVDSDKTKMCSGRDIESPCQVFAGIQNVKLERIINQSDRQNARLAPVAKKCLSYLYTNKGSLETRRNPTGPSYTGLDNYGHTTQNDKNLFCLPEGELNPDKSTNALLELARIYDNGFRGSVGVEGVQKYLTETLQMAVDTRRNANTDPDRKAAIRKCFGKEFKPLSAPAMMSGSPRVVADPPKFTIRDQQGRQWKINRSDNSIRLRSGTNIEVDLMARPDVFKANQGRIGLFIDGNPSMAIRHSGFVLWAHPFAAQNFDWAWYPIRGANNTVVFYNDYGGGTVLGYDDPSDRLLIVPKGDPRIVNWVINPFPASFVKDDQALLVVPKPTIRLAWYGTRYREVGADVTQRAIQIQNSGAAALGSFNNLYGDPTPGVFKYLWVDFNPPGSTQLKQLIIPENQSRSFRDFNDSAPNAPPYTPPTAANLPASFVPRQNTRIGTAKNNGDYILQMTIRPFGIVGNWGSIVHFTINGRDCCGLGERMPAIWFFPQGLRLHVRIGDARDGNWGVDTGTNCAVGRDNTFRLECRGSDVTVQLNNEIIRVKQPTRRPTGTAIVFAADGFYQAANCQISNFKFTALN